MNTKTNDWIASFFGCEGPEEVVNALTHGLGLVLSVIGGIVLLNSVLREGDNWLLLGCLAISIGCLTVWEREHVSGRDVYGFQMIVGAFVLLFGVYVSEAWAAGVGLVFVLGRALYARGYVLDPARRGPGFGLTLLSNGILVVGGLIGAIVHLL